MAQVGTPLASPFDRQIDIAFAIPGAALRTSSSARLSTAALPRLTPVCDACDWLSTPERDGDFRSDPWLVLHTGVVGVDSDLYPGDTDWCGR